MMDFKIKTNLKTNESFVSEFLTAWWWWQQQRTDKLDQLASQERKVFKKRR